MSRFLLSAFCFLLLYVNILTMAEERDLVAGIIQLGNLLNRRLAPIFEKSNVTPQQWAVLITIAEEPVSLAGVARKLAVSKQNMTGMIARLEQLALVERSENPNDLRSARVQLTRRGRALVEKLGPVYEEWQKALGRDLPDRDLQTLTRAVNRLIAQLEQP
jgi:DNA-binding MarR family transcriptional regulator